MCKRLQRFLGSTAFLRFQNRHISVTGTVRFVLKLSSSLARERSKRDTIRGVQIRAGAVYVYIYIFIT